MIRFAIGDILAEDAEALVNTVNCVGVMGRGIALQFKNAFPANFHAYKAACRRGEVQPGRMFVFETGWRANPRLIVNFPTKRHWRATSRIEDIESGLKALRELVRERGIRSIAVPPLGSGLGGLDWNSVRPRIEETLRGIDNLQAVVFEPHQGAGRPLFAHQRDVPEMTQGRAALLALMDSYLRGLGEPYVTLLEVHKLLYFLQLAGEPLRLRFKKAHYGPYAENLRHVLKTIEGHFLSGYLDGGDEPYRRLDLIPGVVDDARAVLLQSPETQGRFERVAGLIEGFESPFGLELLATVHWVLANDQPESPIDLINLTHAWNQRKEQFKPWQIELAADTLRRQRWITDIGAATR